MKVGLLFSTKDFATSAARSAESFISCVNNVPFAFDVGRISHKRFHPYVPPKLFPVQCDLLTYLGANKIRHKITYIYFIHLLIVCQAKFAVFKANIPYSPHNQGKGPAAAPGLF